MTARDDFDRHLAAWLTADAPTSEPEHLLGEVLARTARTRRRPAWRIPERWIPMSVVTSRAAISPRVPWRTVGLVALLVLALVAAAIVYVGSRSRALPAPFGPAMNGPVIYAASGELLVRSTLDAPAARFAPGPDKVTAFFSRDGSKVAYLRAVGADGDELWVADPDGANARKVGGPFKDDGWYEWSPDGSLVAVQSVVDHVSIVTLVRTDGSGSRVLDVGTMQAGTPTFRPTDGNQLLIRGGHDENWGFYLVNLDGTDLTHLDLAPGFASQPYYETNHDYYFMAPTWSPDGARLAFHTLEPAEPDPGFRIHVAAIGPTGAVSDERILEYTASARDEFDAAWLPSNDGLVFKSLDGTQLRVRTGAPAPGAAARDIGDPLATSDLHASGISFAVSPDGSLVVARPQAPDAAQPLWVSDVATGTQTRALFDADDIVSWQRLARSGGTGR